MSDTTSDVVLKPTEAAALIKVSREFLRRSDCPKHPLPSSRGKGVRRTVRYRRSEVMAWFDHWTKSRSAA